MKKIFLVILIAFVSTINIAKAAVPDGKVNLYFPGFFETKGYGIGIISCNGRQYVDGPKGWKSFKQGRSFDTIEGRFVIKANGKLSGKLRNGKRVSGTWKHKGKIRNATKLCSKVK